MMEAIIYLLGRSAFTVIRIGYVKKTLKTRQDQAGPGSISGKRSRVNIAVMF